MSKILQGALDAAQSLRQSRDQSFPLVDEDQSKYLLILH
jgi:hypothetical protein